MSYNRIARYALSGESSPHFYPEGEQISMIDITMNEESEPILAGRSDLFFYKPEADKFARIPILTEKEKENPINLTKLCLVPDWGILAGTTGKRKQSSQIYRFATSSSVVRIRTGSHPSPVSTS